MIETGDKLKAAIIGLGNQAIEDHIPGILMSRYAKLVAVCDLDRNKSDLWAKKLNVASYTDFYQLFNNESIDFVIIATPHNTHKSIVEEATIKRVNVLKEKPFAINLDDAAYLKQICDKRNIVLMTTMQRRFNPIYNTFFQLKDLIGDTYFIDINYNFFVKNPQEGWRGNKKIAGGGCILDMGYHMIDMILWYFGLPNSIYAEVLSVAGNNKGKNSTEDTAIILFSYKNGTKGSLTLSRYLPPKTEMIRVLGGNGIIELQRGSIKRFQNDGLVVDSLLREGSWEAAKTDQIDYFCQVILGKRFNFSGPAYHLQHMSFVEACYKSLREKRSIDPTDLLKEKICVGELKL